MFENKQDQNLSFEIISLADDKCQHNFGQEAAAEVGVGEDTFLLDDSRDIQTKTYRLRMCTELKLCSALFSVPRGVWNSGPWSIVFAALFYSLSTLGVKVISGNIQFFEIALIRSFLNMIVCILVSLKFQIRPVFGKCQLLKLMFARAAFGTIAFLDFYYSVDAISLGDASAIFFMNAAFTAVLSWLILKQKIAVWGFLGIISSIAGVVFISHPPFLFGGNQQWSLQRILGVVIGLVASATAGYAFVLTTAIGERESPITISLWFHATSITAVVPVVLGYPFNAKFPNGFEILMLFVVTLGSFLGQIMVCRAFQQDKASKIATIFYVQVIFSYMWGFIFLQNSITWFGMVGAGLIALGVLLVNKDKDRGGEFTRTKRSSQVSKQVEMTSCGIEYHIEQLQNEDPRTESSSIEMTVSHNSQNHDVGNQSLELRSDDMQRAHSLQQLKAYTGLLQKKQQQT